MPAARNTDIDQAWHICGKRRTSLSALSMPCIFPTMHRPSFFNAVKQFWCHFNGWIRIPNLICSHAAIEWWHPEWNHTPTALPLQFHYNILIMICQYLIKIFLKYISFYAKIAFSFLATHRKRFIVHHSITVHITKAHLFWDGLFDECRHLSNFPGRHQPSIFDVKELNCRVRNGNGWDLFAISTD